MSSPTSGPDRLAAALADRYRFERELGHGGMATVYLAADLKHDRKVAIKVLKPDLAAVLGAERFVQEIKTTATLQHPHILPLFDSGQADSWLFYVMPYVDGETLRLKLDREKQLGIEEALRITREVADALGYAHSLGIVHRDIKPENVLLQAGHALVADFGIAHAAVAGRTDRLTATGVVIGTPAYMSPEQALGDRDLDARSDLYSLGCLLYEMLAGDPPFRASTAQAILARKSMEPAPVITSIRETVPPHVEAALARALARLPGDRFPTVHEFAAALAGPVASAGAAPRSAIAVLPFTNVSPDRENEYFSDGITEEIINVVAQIPGFQVTARTSAFQFKGKDLDIREIGRKLNVGTVLEGSVRKAGPRVRVTAQLVDVANGYHLWSERFDRDLADVFMIQDEIARALAQRLRREFAPADVQATMRETRADPAAYDAYLRGRYHLRQMFSAGNAIERAVTSFQKAIARDPELALAYSALAEAYVVLGIGLAQRPNRETMPAASEAAERALALDANLAEAHLARALVAMYYKWDYPAARAGIDRAIAINPNSVDAHFWAEFYYSYVERDFARALAANRRAAKLDPPDLNIATRHAQVLMLFDRLDEAIAHLTEIAHTDPGFRVCYLQLADAYSRKGEGAKAIAAGERAVELSAGTLVPAAGILIIATARHGAEARARELLGQLTERARREYVFPFWLAAGYAALGDTDRAFEYLAEAQRDRDPNLLYISAAPRWLWQADPRYVDVLRAIGLGHLAP